MYVPTGDYTIWLSERFPGFSPTTKKKKRTVLAKVFLSQVVYLKFKLDTPGIVHFKTKLDIGNLTRHIT